MKNPETACSSVMVAGESQAVRQPLWVQSKRVVDVRVTRTAARVLIDKDYQLEGVHGKVRLLDMFEGRRQLLLYHFMFTSGLPDGSGGSLLVDMIGQPTHFDVKDVSFALVSLAPLSLIESCRQRLGWSWPWYSSAGTDFHRDFGVSADMNDTFQLSVFTRDDAGNIYQAYATPGDGAEVPGSAWA